MRCTQAGGTAAKKIENKPTNRAHLPAHLHLPKLTRRTPSLQQQHMQRRRDLLLLIVSHVTHHLAEGAKLSRLQVLRRPRQVLRQPDPIDHLVITPRRPDHLSEYLFINIT